MAAPKLALDRLDQVLNNVFLQIGSVFHDTDRKHPLNMTYHRMRLEKEIPRALAEWHDAFDDLENEVVRARAILRRDVAVEQARRQRAVEAPKDGQDVKVGETKSTGEEEKDTIMVDAPAEKPASDDQTEATKIDPLSADAASTTAKAESSAINTPPNPANSTTSTPTLAPADSTTAAPTSAPSQALPQPPPNGTTSQLTDSGHSDPKKSTPPPTSQSQARSQTQTPPNPDAEADTADYHALLPGLEQYANVDPNNVPDNHQDQTEGADDQRPDNDLGDGTVQDNSFEDLFDWGLGEEDGGRNGELGGEQRQEGGDDMFDADFFNLG